MCRRSIGYHSFGFISLDEVKERIESDDNRIKAANTVSIIPPETPNELVKEYNKHIFFVLNKSKRGTRRVYINPVFKLDNVTVPFAMVFVPDVNI